MTHSINLLRTGATLVVASIAAGCLLDRRPNEITHPTQVNLPPRGSPTIRSEGSPRDLEGESLEGWRKMRDALLAEADVLASLGDAGDSGQEAPDLFATELDVALDSVGNLLILDRGNQAVKVFGPRGDHIVTLGRPGDGSQEFRNASALDLLSDRRLVVTERGGRLKIFLPADSEDGYASYAYSSTHVAGVGADHSCAINGRVFIARLKPGHDAPDTLIHAISLSPNGINRSFGQGYEDDYWLVRDMMSQGPIACLGDLGVTLFAFQFVPVVKADEVDTGNLLWTTKLEGYLQPPIVEETRPDGTSRVVYEDADVVDRVTTLTTVSARHALLQTVRLEFGPTDSIDGFEVRSHLIDAETGQGAFITNSLPLIQTVDPTYRYYAAVWLLPFPRVELRRFGG